MHIIWTHWKENISNKLYWTGVTISFSKNLTDSKAINYVKRNASLATQPTARNQLKILIYTQKTKQFKKKSSIYIIRIILTTPFNMLYLTKLKYISLKSGEDESSIGFNRNPCYSSTRNSY